MNSPIRSGRVPAPPGALRSIFALALATGLADVSVALLRTPRDFEPFAALVPPVFATAAVALAICLAAWLVVRPVSRRLALSQDGTLIALGAFVCSFLVLLLVADLHIAPISPHLLFRTAMIGTISALLGACAYAAHDAVTRRHGLDDWWQPATQALPLLMFEVVVFEWLVVYSVESVTSAAGLLAVVGLLAALAATTGVVLYARRGAAPDRMLVAMVLLLTAAPLVDAGLPQRSAAAAASAASSTGAPKQIVLISIDSLRADAVSAYSPGRSATPALDGLANESVLFERAMATAPWTLPSMASVLTGLSPSVHLVTSLTARLSDRVTTLAESLRGRGYRTAAIVHNPLLEPSRNFAQGFDEYVDLHEPSYGESLGHRLLQSALPSLFPAAPWPLTGNHSATVIDWLEANREESFFLWVHVFDPHLPYTPRPEQLGARPPGDLGFAFEGQSEVTQGVLRPAAAEQQWIRRLYDAEVRDVDANVEEMLDTLKRLGLYDGALIVVTSDHGEEFWEHGAQGHGHALYDELLRVPLVVKVPGSTVRGRRSAPVTTSSIAPTILELSGITFDPGSLSAPSLVPLLQADTPDASGRAVVSSVVWSAGPLVDGRDAVLMGDSKYILARDPAHDQLFDLAVDPGERRSLSASAPERLAAGRQLLERHLEAAAGLRKRLGIEEGSLTIDENTLRQLRSLGYVQ